MVVLSRGYYSPSVVKQIQQDYLSTPTKYYPSYEIDESIDTMSQFYEDQIKQYQDISKALMKLDWDRGILIPDTISAGINAYVAMNGPAIIPPRQSSESKTTIERLIAPDIFQGRDMLWLALPAILFLLFFMLMRIFVGY